MYANSNGIDRWVQPGSRPANTHLGVHDGDAERSQATRGGAATLGVVSAVDPQAFDLKRLVGESEKPEHKRR